MNPKLKVLFDYFIKGSKINDKKLFLIIANNKRKTFISNLSSLEKYQKIKINGNYRIGYVLSLNKTDEYILRERLHFYRKDETLDEYYNILELVTKSTKKKFFSNKSYEVI